MQIFFPYASEELCRYILQDNAINLGIHMEHEFLGAKRIRRTAPIAVGVPHKAFKVRLFPLTDEYRKLSIRTWDTSYRRRMNAVCWHGYKNFFVRLLLDGNSDATIRTGYISKGGIEYNGLDDFISKYAATKSLYYNEQTACECTGDKLATWEVAQEHLPPRIRWSPTQGTHIGA